MRVGCSNGSIRLFLGRPPAHQGAATADSKALGLGPTAGGRGSCFPPKVSTFVSLIQTSEERSSLLRFPPTRGGRSEERFALLQMTLHYVSLTDGAISFQTEGPCHSASSFLPGSPVSGPRLSAQGMLTGAFAVWEEIHSQWPWLWLARCAWALLDGTKPRPLYVCRSRLCN